MHNIKVMRVKRRMNQEELAKLLGVSRITISCWEIGKTSPSLVHLKKLAEILNCSIDELVND